MSKLLYKIGQIRVYKGDEWWFNDLLAIKKKYGDWRSTLREVMRVYNEARSNKAK